MGDPRDSKYRVRKACEQRQRCFYCGFPMWSKRADGFARHWGITLKEAARFHCTAEHLLARRDGGTSCANNIVAACLFCNRARHQRSKAPEPDRYRIFVRKRVERFAWHHPRLHKMLGKHHRIPPN